MIVSKLIHGLDPIQLVTHIEHVHYMWFLHVFVVVMPLAHLTTNDYYNILLIDAISITSAIRISATEIRINWINSIIPRQEETTIMIFCGKSANMIAPYNCQTTELCGQEEISSIQLTNHVSLLDQLDPQSGYCIQLRLSNYSSLQTFVESELLTHIKYLNV